MPDLSAVACKSRATSVRDWQSKVEARDQGWLMEDVVGSDPA